MTDCDTQSQPRRLSPWREVSAETRANPIDEARSAAIFGIDDVRDAMLALIQALDGAHLAQQKLSRSSEPAAILTAWRASQVLLAQAVGHARLHTNVLCDAMATVLTNS